MKAKFFLMFASAAMLLAACSKDDIGSGGDDSGIVTDPKGDAWVSLRVITPSTRSTRALNSDPIKNATEAESTIKEVRAIFFDADSDPLVTADIVLTLDQAGLVNGQAVGIGEAFQVPATSKRILIVANPSSEFPSTESTSGETYSIINKAIKEDASIISNENDGFMMTNAKGGLEPSKSDGVDSDLTLYKTADLAEKAPLSIKLDRVVAKVHVEINPIADDEVKAEIKLENGGWLLNVTNKKYFPVSKRLPTWFEENGGGFRTPFDDYKLGSYRIDPNYNTQDSEEYNVYAEDKGLEWKESDTDEYCLENTQDSINNVHAYTTHVLFKIKFIPTEYKLPNKETTGRQGDNADWMYINTGYYTFETLKAWIETELTAKVNANGGVVPMPLTNAFNKYLVDLGINEITIPDDEAGIATAMTAFEAAQSAIELEDDRARTVGSFTYYVGGVCYYRAMIRHDDTNEIVNALGEFGVVRNSYYDISVSKFNHPGYPTIPEPSPKDPDEDGGNWLSIQINVNPWTWYKQVEEF